MVQLSVFFVVFEESVHSEQILCFDFDLCWSVLMPFDLVSLIAPLGMPGGICKSVLHAGMLSLSSGGCTV
uniref:Uncharacterized protein n=1 Tax=Anguilla anguilla TaxID=7936 RepID=A0A0E9X484_ANGAN